MQIEKAYLKKFDEEQKFLSAFYPRYSSSFKDRLWYAEFYTGNKLDRFLSLEVNTIDTYWGDGNAHLPFIRNNVLTHLRNVSDFGETLRLVKPGREDTEWRQKDSALINLIAKRYGREILEYKIDQTVSVADITDKKISVQRSSYIDQFGSNIFCDEPDHGVTLRGLNRIDGGLSSFKDSTLANTVGVAAIFVDRNGVPLLRWRRHEDPIRRMAIMPEGFHCTSSGVLTWQDFTAPTSVGTRKTMASVVAGIERETANEAGIFAHEKHGENNFFNTRIIAFARELKRAGKPQFFFRIDFPDHTAEEIRDEILRRPKTEGDEYGGRRSPLGRIFGVKGGESKNDFLIRSDLNLNTLTRASLNYLSRRNDGVQFTFEAYANIYFSLSE